MAIQVTFWQDKAGSLHQTQGAARRGDFIFDLVAALPAAMPDKNTFAANLVDNFDTIKTVIKEYKG